MYICICTRTRHLLLHLLHHLIRHARVGMHAASELGGSKIETRAEFRFFLLEHWNLYDAMKHSNYIASKLEIWKDRTTTKLDTLLAKMGIPLEQAKQKYMHMKQNFKETLHQKLDKSDELGREFSLDKISVPTFCKERKAGMLISAIQCTRICNALLCLPPSVSISSCSALHIPVCVRACACAVSISTTSTPHLLFRRSRGR